MKVLVKFVCDYQDEITVSGFRIMTHEELDKFMETLDNIRRFLITNRIPSFDVRFGYTYCWEYEDIAALCRHLEFTRLTDKQAAILTELFGNEYGYFPWDSLNEWLHDAIVKRDME